MVQTYLNNAREGKEDTMISKEAFTAQFPCRINPESVVFGKPLHEAMTPDTVVHGIQVYRCLNLLLIRKDDGKLYCSG